MNELEKDYKTIAVSQETWKKLHMMKSYPSETFDDIIGYLIDNEVKK